MTEAVVASTRNQAAAEDHREHPRHADPQLDHSDERHRHDDHGHREHHRHADLQLDHPVERPPHRPSHKPDELRISS